MKWLSCLPAQLVLLAVAMGVTAPTVSAQLCVTNCQPSNQQGGTPSGDGQFIVADNFVPDVPTLFDAVCFRGGYLDATAGGDCTPLPADDFEVRIYNSINPGCGPGSSIGPGWSEAAGTLSISRVATGNMISIPQVGVITEYEYTATMSFPAGLTASSCIWLEITNDTDFASSGCQWIWASATGGDGTRFVDGDGVNPPDGYDADDDLEFGTDQAFCLEFPFNLQITCDCALDNDVCDFALQISDGSFAFTNVDAKTDGPALPAECDEGFGLEFGADVYFCYTAPCTGVATADLCQSDFDTRIAIYEGCACPESNERLLACNDDGCNEQSMISWEVQVGERYLIRVGGSGPAMGGGVLNVDCETTELICSKGTDQCHPQDPSGASPSGDGNTTLADDFLLGTSDTITSVCWWGFYLNTMFQNCSFDGDDFTIRIYDATGLNGGPGTILAEANQGTGDITVTRALTGFQVLGFFPEYEFRAEFAAGIPVQGGECLWLEIANDTNFPVTMCQWFWEYGTDNDTLAIDESPDGNYEDGPTNNVGDLSFCVGTLTGQMLLDSGACLAPPPANDDCAAAESLTLDQTVMGSTVLATSEAHTGSTCGTTVDGPGVWYRIVGDGTEFTASTCSDDTGFDTKLHVYCGMCEPLVCIGGNDDDSDCLFEGTRNSTVSWCTDVGSDYYVLVSGFSNATGAFALTVTSTSACSPAADCDVEFPENDDCGDAICIADGEFLTGDLSFATTDGAIEEFSCTSGIVSSIDVWYSYTPAVTETVLIDTCGSPTDTVLAIFDMCGALPGDALACNDDSAVACPGVESEIEIELNARQTYLIRVSAFSNQVGPFIIRVTGGGGMCAQDPCPWDLVASGSVDAADLSQVLQAWGPNPGHPADFVEDGNVNAADLAQLLQNWGPCP